MFKALADSSSLRSKLDLAMAEASEDRDLMAGPSIEIELDPAAASMECKLRTVCSKLGSAILIADERQIRATDVLPSHQQS